MGEGGKKDDDYDYVPFQGVEKGIVLQERRTFNETPLNAPKCCHLLTKILYLLHNGETFTTQEATDLFFAVTKLFQSQDVVLRRMTYLVLKELVHMAKDVIIVSASLSKDIAGKNENNKANAIRVLCQTLDDISLLGQQGERLLRQAIVDKDSYVATCALVSAYRLTHVSQQNNEIVKRWLQEISSASSNTENTLVSYHALGLIYKLRQSDKQAVNRLAVSKATQHSKGINSPYEACLFIRIATTLIRENGVEQSQQLLQFLQNCKQGHTMVKFEAAKALCSLEDIVPPAAITTAISMLTSTLSGSSKTTCRASILRILNQLKTPVTNCQHELESLVSDSNLSVATLAISLLLKTGVEANVESHLKTLSNFMSDISDEFKCSVVDSIKGLCVKFPRKKTLLLNFLAKSLRDEGQLAYKTKVVETIFSIIKEIQNTKEEGLIHLCEFIEDCEYTDLSCRIIYFIGEEGPSTHCAHKYIRYLFNRVILENPSIRGAAVQALAKFARRCPELRNRIKILLRRCFGDSHAVVRELSLMQHKILQKEELYSFVDQPLPVPLENLQIKKEKKILTIKTEAALQKYLSMGPSDKAFDISLVPTFKSKPSPSSSSSSSQSSAASKQNNNNNAAAKEVQPQKSLYDALSSIPQLSTLGKRITSSKNPIELTESETEYNVTCVKHLFSNHLVLQFNCTNTLNDQLLENVYVKVQADNEEFSIADEVPIETLSGGSTGSSYIILERGEGFPAATFSCTLKFLAKDVDSSTGEADDNGYEDEYQLEDVEVGVSDYMSVWVPANFQEQWEEIGEENEAVETYSLSSIKSLKQACSEIANFLQMNPCDKTAYIDGKHSTAKHILHLGGKFLADTQVLARSRMKLNPSGGVDMELTVRSSNAEVNQALCNAI